MIRYSRDKTYGLVYEVYSSYANVFKSLGYYDHEPIVKGLCPPLRIQKCSLPIEFYFRAALQKNAQHSLDYCIFVTLILTQHKTKIHSRESILK